LDNDRTISGCSSTSKVEEKVIPAVCIEKGKELAPKSLTLSFHENFEEDIDSPTLKFYLKQVSGSQLEQ
jgi:hypothetical protein